uniref:Beclin-1 n=1 Tax=Phallusia mammillata TaxID=59560 RepID=A0A6F9D825_9ASCI|nr:beclin-1 [Phallusia mammillata]
MGDETVCFMCTKCNQLIKLDSSFDAIDSNTLQDLVGTSQNLLNLAHENQDPIGNDAEVSESSSSDDKPPQEHDVMSSGSDKTNAATESVHSIYDNNTVSTTTDHTVTCQESTNSFTFIGETNGVSMETLSHGMKTIVRLFDIVSGNSNMEHPLCEECTETLVEQLKRESDRCTEECDQYRDYLKTIESSDKNDSVEQLAEELEKLKTEEKLLLSQLDETERERQDVEKEIIGIEKQKQQICKEEEKHMQEYSELRAQQLELEEEQCSADKQLAHVETQLKKLSKTNVFNATFHIWHQGHFGTINGFRLGRLPGMHIEWTEINAAWGQVVLLLSSLAKKMGLRFKRYKLVPFGNHSYLESLDDKSKDLPLYGSGGLRFLWDTKFDQAMVAFLDCLQQFKEEVEGNSGFALPYRMEKGKIEDTGGSGASYSIKMQFNSEEQWTKALKFMLTNLKWGLAWVSTQFAPT